jgi:hypothetical protein
VKLFSQISPTFATAILCCALPFASIAQQPFGNTITQMASELRTGLVAKQVKSAAVLDFTDLDGITTQLGKLLAEETSLALVGGDDLKIIDRANLKRLMDEHKLTSAGLVDPKTAQQLGKLAGVSAIIVGNLTELDGQFQMSTKAIDTETAVILATARTSIQSTESLKELNRKLVGTGKPVADNADGGGAEQLKRPDQIMPPAKRIGPVKIQLLRISKSDSGFHRGEGLEVDVAITSETQSDLRIFLGGQRGADASREQQLLTASVTTSDGTKYALRSIRGVRRVRNSQPERMLPYRYDNSFLDVGPNETATVTLLFQVDGLPRDKNGPETGDLNFEFRSIALEGGDKTDIVRTFTETNISF